MARAFWDPRAEQWIADFRGLGDVGQQRRRVRLDRAKFPQKERAAADAMAVECERYCRALEIAPQDPADVEHAARIRAITDEQATRLRADLPPGPSVKPSRQWTVREAASAHPSTQRDVAADAYRAMNYLGRLDDFCTFAGITKVSEIRLQDAMRWIMHLEKNGKSYDARKHYLLYLKRASRMGATVGIPDQLAGFKLDKRSAAEAEVEAHTLDELGAALRGTNDTRARVAIALMGFLGWRPSEVFRARCGEKDTAGVVEVGKLARKNKASHRWLPLPPTLARWWDELADGRAPDAPLIASRHHGGGSKVQRVTPRHHGGPSLRDTAFSRWLGDHLRHVTKRDLPPKHLRKAFATWAPAVLDGRDIERYLGHLSPFLAQVTIARYQGRRAADELRAAAAIIERTLRAALRPPKAKRHGKLLQRHKPPVT